MKYALIDINNSVVGMYADLPNILRLPSGSIVYCPALYVDYQGLRLVDIITVDNRPSQWHNILRKDVTYDSGTQRITITVVYESSPSIVPTSITIRQAKIAISRAGKLAEVKAAIASLDEETKINWDDALEFSRSSAIILSIASTLGYNSNQIDNLFRTASQI